MNFSASVVAATMVAVCAGAANDAYAAHKLALESILDESTSQESNYYSPIHHASYVHPHAGYASPIHHDPYPYVHEHSVLEVPAHDEYDAFGHDYDTERSTHISYPQRGDHEFHKEYAESCGVRDYCHRFSQMISRDHAQYKSHEYVRNGVQSNHLMTSYYIEPNSLVVHEDAIVASLMLHEHEYYQ